MKAHIRIDKRFFMRYAVFMFFIPALIAVFIIKPQFFSAGNLVSLLSQCSVIGIVAMGMQFIILTGGIDLSVGGSVFLSALVAALIVKSSDSPQMVLPAVLLALAVGVFTGSINGAAIAFLNLPPLITTLAVVNIARGAGNVLVNGRSIVNLPDYYKTLSQGRIMGIPASILVFAAIFALTYIVLNKTRFGHEIYAIGNNANAARASGIPVKRRLFTIYALTGLLCGVGGVLMSARLGGAQIDIGEDLDFSCITAVALGGTSLYGGRGSVAGTLAGVLVVGAVENIMRLVNFPTFYYDVVAGLVIFLAVLFDMLSKRTGADAKTADGL